MTHRLTSKDILALGFMTFALFVGAGNIIFPPMVGIQSGEHVWTAAIGFLLTAVGLPVMTVIALARVGGGVDALSSPIGKVAGIVLATVCYLAVGPLFATPRTATVSFCASQRRCRDRAKSESGPGGVSPAHTVMTTTRAPARRWRHTSPPHDSATSSKCGER